jgi:hypothetical protein
MMIEPPPSLAAQRAGLLLKDAEAPLAVISHISPKPRSSQTFEVSQTSKV